MKRWHCPGVAYEASGKNLRGNVKAAPDICRSRHRGNTQSEAANRRVHHAKYELRTLVWNWFLMRGSDGATCEECSRETGIRYTTASGRISELKREGYLVETGGKKKTSTGASAAVLRARSEAEIARTKRLRGQLELWVA